MHDRSLVRTYREPIRFEMTYVWGYRLFPRWSHSYDSISQKNNITFTQSSLA
jgi:hypothetical protein